MEVEVKNLKAKIENKKTEFLSGIEFVSGKLSSKDVVIAQCGIGKVFASICTEAMILKYSPECIINTGVGGSLSTKLAIGDIAVAESLVQHDMDTSPLGDPVGLISGINKVYFETDVRARMILEESAREMDINYLVGTIATGDKFISEKADKDRIVSLFGASACEMEGGAIAHTAYVNQIPFMVVRAISDSADGDACMDYPTFLPIATKISTALTLALIEKY
jgi:adenosylhomocysteine nucleosidase